MLNTPRVLALRETLVRTAATLATSAYRGSDKELRDQVCLVVEDLKAAGWPPERVIVAIKEIAMDAGLRATQRVLSLRDRELAGRDELMVKIVRWVIECYFDVMQPA
ncbi:MAG: hypothetical protein ACJ796_18665 [Gemmatimonadaceae bacterium]